MQTYCPVVELRQYTLHPGKRDVLIDLFDREFVETQEAVGMTVIGQFRDLDDPDRFVWLRGFRDMKSRAEALGAFYGGPVWQAHRDAANATMINSDDVLLLRPARPRSGFRLDGVRSAVGAAPPPAGLVVAAIQSFDTAPERGFADLFERRLAPVLAATEATLLACFVTEGAANTFPRLPVREGEQVFVSFARLPDPAVCEHYVAALGDLPPRPTQILRLSPTARSLLRG
ncbi:MAG TPA: NIPSNAP family protein [Alphaproteobacteria bacterium]|nr:NIPSNAP family protein [Alphaproteobacteria bacterium]